MIYQYVFSEAEHKVMKNTQVLASAADTGMNSNYLTDWSTSRWLVALNLP